MSRNRLFSVILGIILGTPALSLAQTGTIRGVVFDGTTGESLIGVYVKTQNTAVAVTDIEGKFSFTIAPGTYSLEFSFISYQTITVSDVVVKAGETTVLDNVSLKDETAMLNEVVISSKVLRDSESSLLKIKRNSPMMVDGITSSKFRQIGDSDASDAIKRVTGVSVEGGKYVFVRGLGDRYTKTTLNNVDIPGLDPDRNSIQIDIFPTNLIDNIIVQKSATADMPADFTGGSVNIETKDFPEERVLNVSASLGFNPAMHFNSSYFMGESSNTDWLGVDNGLRELPANPPSSTTSESEMNTFLKGLNKNLSGKNQTSFMDYSLGLSFGNQKNFTNGNSLGYNFSASYKNTSVFYDDVIYGEYQRPRTPATPSNELVLATTQEGAVAERNVLAGVLGGLAYKTERSKYKLAVLHLQNGESRAGKFILMDNDQAVGKSGFIGSSDNLEYSQRSVTNLLLNGEHFGKNKTFSIDWRISPTLSKITDPDIRKTAFTNVNGNDVLSSGAAGFPSRIWRYLDEVNIVAKVDFKKEHSLFNKEGVLKFGASQIYKERDFKILTYNMVFNGSIPNFEGDPENIMKDEYLSPNGPIEFASANGENANPNSYNSTVSNTAIYISEQFSPIERLKAIIGLRAENYIQRHTGRDAIYASGNTEAGRNLANEKVLDKLNLFPSANLIYSLAETQNLRFSYARSIARPSFKELSFAQIIDPLSNRIFNGGLFAYPGEWDGNLTETNIDNLDLRWELFMQGGQLFSVSAFYKSFQRPIELVRVYSAYTNNEFQPRNVGHGQVLGAEIEVRKSLDFIIPALDQFFISGNITLVKSSIDMTSSEFEARKQFERPGEKIKETRDMSGQAPYMINVGLSYENSEKGWDGGIFYNVNGRTLTVVGGGIFPDVYSQPFHSLNLNMNKEIGESRRTTINISVSNILGDKRENFFTAFKADDQYFSRLNPGTSFSVGLKYNLIK